MTSCELQIRNFEKTMAAVQCQWTEEMERLLITFYMEHQCLWNVKAKSYKNRDQRKKALEELCQQLTNEHQIVNEQDVKKKFKNLRTVFAREHSAVVDSSRSGSGATEVYLPKWKYYTSLLFLRDSCSVDESADNLDVQEPESTPAFSQIEGNGTSQGGGLSPQISESQKITKKSNQRSSEKKAAEAMDYALDVLKRKAASKHAGFLHYLENILDDIPECKVKKLKRQIIEMAHAIQEEENLFIIAIHICLFYLFRIIYCKSYESC
ncbi:hypothetical protein ACEWY4_001304 [Coilia grayii]|uniref:MADF domain-containing protein n=1 Tax=Coilia grayii TaxID=363190 RepID=A0ABD1KT52_9TELE